MYRLPRHRLFTASSTDTTGSSAHLGVPRLRTSIPKTCLPPFSHPSLPETESSSPLSPLPRLSASRLRRSPDAAEIFSNVASSFCSAAAYRHNRSRNFSPPLYPVSFEQTSNIGRRSTHSANVTCLFSIYSCRSFVSATRSTLYGPSFVQVSSPSIHAFISDTHYVDLFTSSNNINTFYTRTCVCLPTMTYYPVYPLDGPLTCDEKYFYI